MTGRAAPIAIFIYARPDHTARMIESVLQNHGAADSRFYVFCDGARDESARAGVEASRAVAHRLLPDATFVMQERNIGLANSIIAGVTRVCNEHGRVIVLEDDLVLSPAALEYFNRSLDVFADEDRVMHIAGYMFPTPRALPELFFYREASCWGWATWSRAWKMFEPDSRRLLTAIRKAGLVDAFNVAGSYKYEKMLYDQWRGHVDSWAIRWYASVFLNGGLCLHPRTALVSNTGLDGTGSHSDVSDLYDVDLAWEAPKAYPEVVEESSEAVTAMVAFHHLQKEHRKRKREQGAASFSLAKELRKLHYRLRLPI